MSFGRAFEYEYSNFLRAGGQFYTSDDRRTTIAAVGIRGGSMIRISVAHCRDGDIPDAVIGRAIALENSVNGQSILVKFDKNKYVNFSHYLFNLVEAL